MIHQETEGVWLMHDIHVLLTSGSPYNDTMSATG